VERSFRAITNGGGCKTHGLATLHREIPGCSVEVLTPDFKGKVDDILTVLKSKPEIMSHNMETIRRLHWDVRPQARYERSLAVLRQSVEFGLQTKTSIMVGLGERNDEIFDLMRDVRQTGTQVFSLGQYLQPTVNHLPVRRYVTPDEFEAFKIFGYEIGFEYVESGPLVRSSYHADEQIIKMEKKGVSK
jgi:lipoyl synthase